MDVPCLALSDGFCTESGTEVHLETLALCRITFWPLVHGNSASINLINA